MLQKYLSRSVKRFRGKYFISVSLRPVREDAAFLQNKRVQSYHAAQSKAYAILFVTAYMFLFSFLNTQTHSEMKMFGQ